MAKQDTLRKLHKLLNQQRGEEALGNWEAAALFASKISELLIKHKIELHEISSPDEDVKDPLTQRWVTPDKWGEPRKGERATEIEFLASAIAEHFFCQVLCEDKGNNLLFVGRGTDIEICLAVFTRIMRLGVALCETELAKEILTMPEEDGLEQILWKFHHSNAKFRRSFLSGYGFKIKDRLDTERARIDSATADSTALVRASADVVRYVKEQFVLDETPVEPKDISRRAYNMGYRHGESVTLRPNALTE